MNAKEYLGHLSEMVHHEEILKRVQDGLVADMKRAGKPFVSFDGSCTSADEVIAEAMGRPQRILNRIQSILAGSDLELKRPPAIGYFPIGDLNAVSTMAPNGDPIVLIDLQLRQALYVFASSLIYLGWETRKAGDLGKTPQDVCHRSLEAIGAAIRLFLRDESAHSDVMKFAKWLRDKAPPEIPESGDVLSDAMITFVLAHEYGHHVLGHVNQAAIRNYALFEGHVPIRLVATSHLQEKEADQMGADIFLACADAESDSLAFRHIERLTHAPLLFFDIISTVETTKHFRSAVLHFHPPALERKKLLSDKVQPILRDDSRRAYDFFSGVLAIVREQILYLNL